MLTSPNMCYRGRESTPSRLSSSNFTKPLTCGLEEGKNSNLNTLTWMFAWGDRDHNRRFQTVRFLRNSSRGSTPFGVLYQVQYNVRSLRVGVHGAALRTQRKCMIAITRCRGFIYQKNHHAIYTSWNFLSSQGYCGAGNTPPCRLYKHYRTNTRSTAFHCRLRKGSGGPLH